MLLVQMQGHGNACRFRYKQLLYGPAGVVRSENRHGRKCLRTYHRVTHEQKIGKRPQDMNKQIPSRSFHRPKAARFSRQYTQTEDRTIEHGPYSVCAQSCFHVSTKRNLLEGLPVKKWPYGIDLRGKRCGTETSKFTRRTLVLTMEVSSSSFGCDRFKNARGIKVVDLSDGGDGGELTSS